LKFGIVTRSRNAWSSVELQEALSRQGVQNVCFGLSRMVASVARRPCVQVGGVNVLEDLDALIVRPVGRGSVEELVFRMDMLYRLERLGLYIVNPPEAIEHCVDKYDVLTILEENDLPVPHTVVTESVAEAMKAFAELGEDVVVKPLFGSRGLGATRVNDSEIASTVFKAIVFYHGVIYVQKFVPHGCSDLRAFVVGNNVIAAMRRIAENWKTNYSQGARPESTKLDKALEDMAVKSAESVRCKAAGVDILESPDGPVVCEVNSQPGWKGLQSVSNICIADAIIEFMLSELRK